MGGGAFSTVNTWSCDPPALPIGQTSSHTWGMQVHMVPPPQSYQVHSWLSRWQEVWCHAPPPRGRGQWTRPSGVQCLAQHTDPVGGGCQVILERNPVSMGMGECSHV